ncbi:hypothetical protein PPTG_24519 [Phytophthora nicotianae INRA-310]|uniref:Uncharacterized protein n=1 Tax=Phytophthora nicotianae (strain INRA-310) TaxID=761204 RepID=W2PD52_PHYN3|nr:hypothetical protein PPTG_24519 [Phytophthora nicotianae INRA-310]ETM98972.1 hypothetical protein PPTG_24519 [Phytophthora nicotianae INRA-310]
MQYSLLSEAVGDLFKSTFPNAKKCVLFFAHRIKFEAKTGQDTRLYQFEARPTNTEQAHAATSGSGEN